MLFEERKKKFLVDITDSTALPALLHKVVCRVKLEEQAMEDDINIEMGLPPGIPWGDK